MLIFTPVDDFCLVKENGHFVCGKFESEEVARYAFEKLSLEQNETLWALKNSKKENPDLYGESQERVSKGDVDDFVDSRKAQEEATKLAIRNAEDDPNKES